MSHLQVSPDFEPDAFLLRSTVVLQNNNVLSISLNKHFFFFLTFIKDPYKWTSLLTVLKKKSKNNETTVEFKEKSLSESKKMHFHIEMILFKILC